MSGTGCRIVLTTTDTPESARRIATGLVERQLAACVNIVPGLTSIYRWRGAVESAPEFLLLIKTTDGMLPALEAAIGELHSYEIPEFLVLPVEAGSAAYLDWLYHSVKP
jgi:periplasmic divalent cation tolerance protein